MVYHYVIYKYTPTVTGNLTSTQSFNETVNIATVNTTTAEGEVGYVLKIDAITNQTHTTTSVLLSNFTTIFDPYNNNTYQGRLGFPAFIYTDVQNGSTSFTFNYIIKGSPPGNGTIPPQNFHVNVTKNSHFIQVDFNERPFPTSFLWNATMKFDAQSGVLQNFEFATYLFGEYTIFYYTLTSYTHNPGLNLTLLGVAVVGLGVAAVAAAILTRPSRSKKKEEKMRKKFGKQ